MGYFFKEEFDETANMLKYQAIFIMNTIYFKKTID